MELNLDRIISDGLAEVEKRLLDDLSQTGQMAQDLTTHLVKAGGKRVRPMLTLLAAQAGPNPGQVTEDVYRACVVVEMTHLATLYHDDVMDSAPTRRGAPSAQHLWGNNRAILAGDIIFARASRMCALLGPRAVSEHANTFERLCTGQLNESFGPGPQDDPVAFYIQVLADKTGSLVAQAANFGAWLAGASPEVVTALTEYGERIGVAFQIADDVIDLTTPAEQSGKTPGTDLREGVKTLPVLLLEQARGAGELDAAGEEILELLGTDLSSDAALGEVVARMGRHAVLGQTRDLAQEWARGAKDVVKETIAPGQVRDALTDFADMVVQRVA